MKAIPKTRAKPSRHFMSYQLLNLCCRIHYACSNTALSLSPILHCIAQVPQNPRFLANNLFGFTQFLWYLFWFTSHFFLWIACCVYLLAFGMGSKPCELQESNVITWNFLVYDIALPVLVFWVKRNTDLQIQIQNKVRINLEKCTQRMS